MTTQVITGLDQIASLYCSFVFDQFGVLHDGTSLYPNVFEVLKGLKQSGKQCFVLTNSGKTEAQNLHRIERIGIPADTFDGAVTSGDIAQTQVLPEYVRRLGPNMFHISGPGEDTKALQEFVNGLYIVDALEDANFVYLSGMPDEINPYWYRSLFPEMKAIELPLLCSNPDFASPRPDGLAISPGRIAADYEQFGGTVELVGKPQRNMYEACLNRIGNADPSATLFIGDSYQHDIRGAALLGFDSLMLLGGVHAATFKNKKSDLEILETVRSSIIEDGLEPLWVARNL